MISLFVDDGGVNATAFLADHAERITLLATPGFLSRLHYAERDARGATPGTRFGEIDVRQMTVALFRLLAQWNAEAAEARAREATAAEHLYLVADETGEGARLAALRADYPHLTFKGLAEHLFPALIARNPRAVFAPVRQDLAVSEITLIFATKRSGSSYLGDVVRDCGLGDAREHLRDQVIAALASDYRFNRAFALRNFLNLIAAEGRVATKLITHFVADYLKTGARDLTVLAELCAGITPRVITLDRSDKVGQAVSAYLAARRGVWHVRSKADAAKLGQKREEAGQVTYDFNALLVRYAEYRQSSAVLDLVRGIFPVALDLDYNRDVDGLDPAALAVRLSGALGFSIGRMGGSAANRQKLANAENDAISARFREEYRALFGVEP
jgi:LPS sulfotransferase NodH